MSFLDILGAISGYKSKYLEVKREKEDLALQIADLKKQLEPIPPPLIVGQIDGLEVYDLLTEIGIPSVYISDDAFDLTTLDEIGRFLEADKTNEFSYQKRIYDCENFTRHLLGNISVPGWARIAFGKAWGDVGFGEHALNISIHNVDGENKAFYIESQTDEIKPLTGRFTWAEI